MPKHHIGGQAVLEGVMMRGKNFWSLAVRTPEDEIICHKHKFNSLSARYAFLNKPIIRGMVALIETVALGFKALSCSAKLAMGQNEEQISPWEMTISLIFALILVVGLFMVLPFYLTRLASSATENRFLFTVAEGGIRIGIFVAYVFIVSRIKDIRRVFEYHGAEHKSIHAFEAGAPLTPEAVIVYSPLHVRCSTSFLLIVLVLAIFAFSFLPTSNIFLRVGGKFILIPLISGISYEIIKLAALHEDSKIMKLIMAPGLWLQRLTTKEPDEKQIEVALCALKEILEAESTKE